jgi:hypothetical protein
MACIPGRFSRVQTSFDNGNTYKNLGSLVDATLNGNVDELECTSHDSNGIREYLPNHVDFTMDMTLRFDEDEPEQVKILNSVLPTPTSFKIYFLFEQANGRLRIEADAFVTSWSPSTPLDDTTNLDVSLRLSKVRRGIVSGF